MRVATFNIKHGAPADGYRGNPEAVAAACANLQADILALQEVDQGVIRSRRADLAALAAEASGMRPVFCQTLKFSFGSYGNALLVRGDINDIEELELGGGHRFKIGWGNHRWPVIHEPRKAILASVDVAGHKVSVAATHLSTEPAIRAAQLPQVVKALSARAQPQVLMGDFNLGRKQLMAALARTSFELADSQPTFPASNPRRSIDHIAVSGLAIQAAWTETFDISDHRALVAEVIPAWPQHAN